jgi:hypothetical protein
VCVPHDHAGGTCVNDGQAFNSLGPCSSPKGGGPVTRLDVAAGPEAHDSNVARLDYALAASSDVLVAVYDVAGRCVATLVNESQSAGAHQVTWNHLGIPQGLYFCRLRTREVSLTRPVMVLR